MFREGFGFAVVADLAEGRLQTAFSRDVLRLLQRHSHEFAQDPSKVRSLAECSEVGGSGGVQ